MDLITYSLLLKKIKGVATGVSTARYDAENRSIIFTTNSGVELSIPMPNGLSGAEIEMISHMELAGNEEEGFYITVDGERVGSKTCTFTTTVDGLAMPKGTVLNNVEPADVLKDMLVAKFPPEITFTSSLSTTSYYEIGEEKDVTLDITATKKSYDLKKVEITSTPVLSGFSKTITVAPWKHNGSFTISDSQRVTVKATDVEGLSTSKNIDYNFIYPIYASYCSADVTEITEADIISGQKVIKPKQAITLAYSSNDVLLRPIFCFNASYGELRSIQDVLNKIELISNYTKYEVQIECLDGNKVNYYAYVANTEAILDDFEIKFSW